MYVHTCLRCWWLPFLTALFLVRDIHHEVVVVLVLTHDVPRRQVVRLAKSRRSQQFLSIFSLCATEMLPISKLGHISAPIFLRVAASHIRPAKGRVMDVSRSDVALAA